MTKMTRLERASAALLEAMGNYMGAVAAELQEARCTVAPHSHPVSIETRVLRAQLADRGPAEILNHSIAEAQTEDAEDACTDRSLALVTAEKVWTPERLALLQLDYIAGVDLDDILARLSALPGAPLNSRKSITVIAARNGWRRPESTSRARQRPAAGADQDASASNPQSPTASDQPIVELVPAPPPKATKASSRDLDWTPDRIDYLKIAWARGDSCSTIGKHFGISAGAVQGKRNRLGLPARPSAIIQRPAAAQPPVAAPTSTKQPPLSVSLPTAESSPAAAELAPSTASTMAEKWTDQRLAIAQPMYEAGAPIIEIAVAVNATPGPFVKIPQINLLAGAKGWKRGTPPASAPIVAKDGQIRQWAGERGIVTHGKELPMGVINGRRAHLGLPPFELAVAQRVRVN